MHESYRFDGFTEQARKVVNIAEVECRRFQHSHIGTEHLLLGLASEGEGIAAKVLTHFGMEPNKLCTQIELIMGRGNHAVSGEISLTPRAETMIDFAAEEARRLGHHSIGAEHLLLGLVHEDQSIAAGVLESLGIKLGQVRKLTLEMLNQTAES